MAKAATGPWGTPGVTGSIGPVTFAQGKRGETILKEKPVPTNPQSASQTGNRGMFGWIAQKWAGLDAADQDSYDAAAAADQISSFAQYSKQNNVRWQQSKAPSKNSTAAEALTAMIPTITIVAGSGGAPNVATITPGATNNAWGATVFYKAASAPTGLRAENIAVRDIAVSGSNVVVEHAGDAAGYYGVMVLTEDGVFGAIVTDQAA